MAFLTVVPVERKTSVFAPVVHAVQKTGNGIYLSMRESMLLPNNEAADMVLIIARKGANRSTGVASGSAEKNQAKPALMRNAALQTVSGMYSIRENERLGCG
jgi:hypothetical protein